MAEYFIINSDEPILVCTFVTVLIINVPITVEVLCHKSNRSWLGNPFN